MLAIIYVWFSNLRIYFEDTLVKRLWAECHEIPFVVIFWKEHVSCFVEKLIAHNCLMFSPVRCFGIWFLKGNGDNGIKVLHTYINSSISNAKYGRYGFRNFLKPLKVSLGNIMRHKNLAVGDISYRKIAVIVGCSCRLKMCQCCKGFVIRLIETPCPCMYWYFTHITILLR